MTFLRWPFLCALLWIVPACGDTSEDTDTSEQTGEQTDETEEGAGGSSGSPSRGKDAGGAKPGVANDAGPVKAAPRDGGVPAVVPKDGGMVQSGDAGGRPGTADAGSSGGGGFMFPDLFPATPDAGSAPAPTTPTTPSTGKDPNGPCKDLMLLCFDPIDMFLFNPSACFTCNGGKGCQGCAIPYAY